MKRFLIAFLAIMMIAPVTVTVSAQNKSLEKALKKEYKNKMKEYSKNGWSLFGSSRSLDVALLKHYEKINELGDEAVEIVGMASGERDNVVLQHAINNACNIYARQAGSKVRGRILSDINGGDDSNSEFDHFYAAYETAVEKEIKGELKQSYAIYQQSGNIKNVQVFFVVDEASATKARIRALENAYKESEAAQKYAQKISDFVQEAFKVEQ